MLLFKSMHVEPVKSGFKTATRRQWARCRVKVGSIHKCQTKLFTKKHFARVRILAAYQQPLCDMRKSDYLAEGGYTKKTFIASWKSINGSYDPLESVGRGVRAGELTRASSRAHITDGQSSLSLRRPPAEW